MLNFEFGVAPAPRVSCGAVLQVQNSKFKIGHQLAGVICFSFVLKPLGGIAGRKGKMDMG
jgi:hypothetical protein